MSKKCTNNAFDLQLRLAPTYKTIAIGDLHGDLNLAIKVLLLSKVIRKVFISTNKTITIINKNNTDEYYEWCGGTIQVVQVGDQIDRCRPSNNDKYVTSQDCKTPMKDDEDSDIKILNE